MSEYGYSHWLEDDAPQPVPPATTDTPEIIPQLVASEEAVDLDEITAPAEPDFTEEPALQDGTETAPTASLPNALSSRDQDTKLKPRFKSHSPLNQMVRKDWMKVIEASRDSFDALLFIPDPLDVGNVDDETGMEGPSFTELNNNQRDLQYQEPVLVKVLDCPDERESFQMVDTDGEQDGLGDEVQLLRIAAEGVSVGSILTWNEEMASGALAQRWWYVHRIYGYGTQHVGSLYYCIPARNMDTTEGGIVK